MNFKACGTHTTISGLTNEQHPKGISRMNEKLISGRIGDGKGKR